METQFIQDPWESAENAKEPQFSNEIWGQVEAQSWFCILEKGIGKVEFDPQVHSPDQRRTAIDIVIHSLPEMNLSFDLARNMIAESREWASFVLPSIRDMGISPKQLHGAWVKVQTVPLTDKSGNPITYTDANGIVKEKTTIKFLALFKSEDECRADYLANSGKPSPTTKYTSENGNGNKERETALVFLRAYVQNVCRGQHDLDAVRAALAQKIAEQPLISKYFTVDSAETVALITEYMAK
ncbi:MAG: hypothetical protein ABWK53_10320 [Anaerolineales bacterium]